MSPIVFRIMQHTFDCSISNFHNLLVRFSAFFDLWQVKKWKSENFTNKITVNVSHLTQKYPAFFRFFSLAQLEVKKGTSKLKVPMHPCFCSLVANIEFISHSKERIVILRKTPGSLEKKNKRKNNKLYCIWTCKRMAWDSANISRMYGCSETSSD